jgi:hypothetical protein
MNPSSSGDVFFLDISTPQCWSQGGASGRQVRHWLCHWVALISGIILMVGHPAIDIGMKKTSCGGCIPVSKWVQVVNSYSIWNWVSFSYLCLYYIYIIIHILRLYFHIFSPWETIPQRWGSFTIGCLRGCTACRCGGLATRGFQPRYVHPTLHFRGVLFPYICQTLGFFWNFWGHFSTCEGATPIISHHIPMIRYQTQFYRRRTSTWQPFAVPVPRSPTSAAPTGAKRRREGLDTFRLISGWASGHLTSRTGKSSCWGHVSHIF